MADIRDIGIPSYSDGAATATKTPHLPGPLIDPVAGPVIPQTGEFLTTPVRFGRIWIWTTDGDLAIYTDLGPDNWQQSGGIAQYDAQERPKRPTVLIYKGDVGLEMTVSLAFEGFKGNVGQERKIAQLELMARTKAGDREPPHVKFETGGAIPHDHTHNPNTLWVITNLQWGEYENNEESFKRVRQFVAVTFSQWTTDEVLRVGLGAKGKKYKRYTVKKGDTLKKIAKRRLHKASRWRELARINQIRDGNHLIEGSVLLIPVK